MDNETIKISGLISGSITDGPGIRAVIFTQGCYHHCDGCHNQHTWDPNEGYTKSISDLVDWVIETKSRAITISGGEPMLQAENICKFIKALPKNYHIMLYTGYTFEELLERNNEHEMELLSLTDLLVDGPYRKDEKSLNIYYRGSRNQRILNVADSLLLGKAVLTRRWDQS